MLKLNCHNRLHERWGVCLKDKYFRDEQFWSSQTFEFIQITSRSKGVSECARSSRGCDIHGFFCFVFFLNNQQGLTYIKPKLIFCLAAIWVIHVAKLGFIERLRERSQTFKMPEIAWGMHLAQAVCHSSHVLVILGPAFKTTTYRAPICAFLLWVVVGTVIPFHQAPIQCVGCASFKIVWPMCQEALKENAVTQIYN